MKRRILLISIAIFLEAINGIPNCLLHSQTLHFQNNRRNQEETYFNNLFMYKTFFMPTVAPDTIRFILYTKVANDLLQFVSQEDTLYLAQYELTVAIENTKGEPVAEKIKRGKVFTKDFGDTNARDQFKKEKLSFTLSPGRYNLFIELVDLETNHPLRIKKKITLPNFFSKPFTTTDILFFRSSSKNSIPGKECFPLFPPIRSLSDSSFYAKFYICASIIPQHISLKNTILNDENHLVFADSSGIDINSPIQSITIKLNQKLTFGKYFLSITAFNGKNKILLKKPFYVRWGKHTVFLPSLKEAVETLCYVMNYSQWKRLKKLPPEKQKNMLEKFWKERDPDPTTEENELEGEYYRRVAFANENFAPWQGNTKGWQTDRGRIYIIYGPPSNVETPSLTSGKPSKYEIWYYRNIQKKFVFLYDENTGDYHLVSIE